MIKLQKVTLTNFRIFGNKDNVADFTNSDGNPADFVCFYGQNGMGKTSLFDGIEWFAKGNIYRFEGKNIKKEIKKYKGYILSNRNIENKDDKSYVEVEYSDKSIRKRTVKRAKKEIEEKGYRDYNAGQLNGKKNEKNYILDKQILPHDKIDSFIFANSPSGKYEEWGNFWDSDRSQRNLFNKVYSIKKLIAKRIEIIERSIEEDTEKLEKLVLSDEKVNEINNKIEVFNKTSYV